MSRRFRRLVSPVLASLLAAAPLLATAPQAQAHPRPPGAPHAARARHHHLAHAFHPARRRAAPAARPAARLALFDDGGPNFHQSGFHQAGLASWYGGPRWQGRPMASGARYDQEAFTAAHATLPLGSRVRVALEGGARSVIVTITDRPGTARRVIDLSRGAARALGILDRGVARVTLSAP